jgi:uncharacterized protein (TIGR02001 family)
MHKFMLAAAMAAATAPQIAHAEDAAASGPAISASLTGSTNYEWRGVTQSDNHAAVFAAVNLGYNGFYAGAGTENVDFAGVDQEYDLWGGYALPLSRGLTLDVGFVRYGYVDAPANIDTLEVKGALTGSAGKLSVTGAAYHTRNYFGTHQSATFLTATAKYAATDKISLSGSFGHQNVKSRFNYNTWNLGASYALSSTASVDVRYHDTDDDGALFGRHGKGRLVGSFTVGF